MNHKCHVLDVKALLSRQHLHRLRTKRAQQLLSGPKSSFHMKTDFAFQLEIQVPESGRKSGDPQMPVF